VSADIVVVNHERIELRSNRAPTYPETYAIAARSRIRRIARFGETYPITRSNKFGSTADRGDFAILI
jgi:hypothetical protein